jgi:hypothetical protein
LQSKKAQWKKRGEIPLVTCAFSGWRLRRPNLKEKKSSVEDETNTEGTPKTTGAGKLASSNKHRPAKTEEATDLDSLLRDGLIQASFAFQK